MAIYRGRKVSLNKPIRTPGESKKFKVYVKNPSTGNVNVVRFGDPNMKIKKSQPSNKKNYCARSGGIKGAKNKLSPNYWSRKMWNC